MIANAGIETAGRSRLCRFSLACPEIRFGSGMLELLFNRAKKCFQLKIDGINDFE